MRIESAERHEEHLPLDAERLARRDQARDHAHLVRKRIGDRGIGLRVGSGPREICTERADRRECRGHRDLGVHRARHDLAVFLFELVEARYDDAIRIHLLRVRIVRVPVPPCADLDRPVRRDLVWRRIRLARDHELIRSAHGHAKRQRAPAVRRVEEVGHAAAPSRRERQRRLAALPMALHVRMREELRRQRHRFRVYCASVVGCSSTPTLPTNASLRSVLNSAATFGIAGCVAYVRPPALSGDNGITEAEGCARPPRLATYALHSEAAVGMTTL